jgi:acyl-CoA thioesterase FadM
MICRGDVVAEGSMTIACVQRDANHTMRAVPIPDAIAARFRPASATPPAGSGAASPE